jgi:hypothetical protein
LPRTKAAAEHVVAKIADSGRDIRDKIVGGQRTSIMLPLRAPSNVRHAARKAHFETAGKKEAHSHRLHGQDFRADPAPVALSNVTSTCPRR